MYNRKVFIKDPDGQNYGETGIVVATCTIPCFDRPYEYENTVCKILVANVLSNWIPDKYLEIVREYSWSV